MEKRNDILTDTKRIIYIGNGYFESRNAAISPDLLPGRCKSRNITVYYAARADAARSSAPPDLYELRKTTPGRARMMLK